MDYKDCGEWKNNKLIVVKESNKKFTLDNPKLKAIHKVKVDGCLMTDSMKCDFLFEIGKPIEKVFYVELKGRDINHAYEQIISTAKFCKNTHQFFEKECHIVTSSSPKYSSKTQELQIQLKKYGIALFRYSEQATVTV